MATTTTLEPSSTTHGRPNGHTVCNMHEVEATFTEIERLRKQEAATDPRENFKEHGKRKDHWRMILSRLAVAASLLNGMAENIPVVKPAANAFKVLIRMEQARHDNCELLVDLCYSIGSLLYLCRHFEVIALDEEVDGDIRICMGDIEGSIESLAHFSKFYYSDCQCTLFRIWNSTQIRNKFEGFNTLIERHRSKIHALLVAKSPDLLSRESSDDKKASSAFSAVIRARFEPHFEGREADAGSFIEKWGRGSILKDRNKLNEFAAIFDLKMSESTRDKLRVDMDEVLSGRLESFHRRFESSKVSIGEDPALSRPSLLTLDCLPHELLSDPDIKEVWKENRQGPPICTRYALDRSLWPKLTNTSSPYIVFDSVRPKELSNYVAGMLQIDGRATGVPADSWTLSFLCRAKHHPAIADAIDDDGSGYISIQEVERFSRRRPTTVSLPEWLVYWAVGWRTNNFRYNSSILASLDAIAEKCRKAAQINRFEDVRQAVRQYLTEIDTLRNIAGWADPSDITDQPRAFGYDSIQLRNLIARVCDLEVTDARKHWEEAEWKVEEPSDMAVIFLNNEARIERSFLCVIQVLLETQRDRIESSANLKDGNWCEMADTLGSLSQAFGERVRSLNHGWRAQKVDVEHQVSSFSGGICAGWYSMYGRSHRGTRRNRRFNDMGSAKPILIPTQPEMFTEQLNELGGRIDGLEKLINERMDALQINMASMLRDVLISDIMQERMMKSPRPSSIRTNPNRGSKPVINIEIPSVSFSDVVVNQNGSLHMNTPINTMHETRRRASSDITPRRSPSPNLTRSDSLAMSSFVQTASGQRYIGSYDNVTEDFSSSAYARSTLAPTELIQSEDPSTDHASPHEHPSAELPDPRRASFGLSTPTSMNFQSPPEQYYGGVMLITRSDPTTHLHIPKFDQEVHTSPFSSVVSASGVQGEVFMGRHGYDVPFSALPGTDTDPARSKASKQSANASAGSSGSGFRSGLKSVKESLRGIGSGASASMTASGNRKRKGSARSPATGMSTANVRTPVGGSTPHWLQLQDILDVGQNNEWYAAPSTGSSMNGTVSPQPPSSCSTGRFRRPSNATSTSSSTSATSSPSPAAPSSGSGFSRLASSPFTYTQKVTGPQSRVTAPQPHPHHRLHQHHPSHLHDYGVGDSGSPPGSPPGSGSTRPSFSSARTFGPIGAGGGGDSATVGPALPGLARLPFGRQGHGAGPRSVDVVPLTEMSRWPTARRSRSIDGIGGSL